MQLSYLGLILVLACLIGVITGQGVLPEIDESAPPEDNNSAETLQIIKAPTRPCPEGQVRLNDKCRVVFTNKMFGGLIEYVVIPDGRDRLHWLKLKYCRLGDSDDCLHHQAGSSWAREKVLIELIPSEGGNPQAVRNMNTLPDVHDCSTPNSVTANSLLMPPQIYQ